jgi:hypothetical protein
MGLTLKKMIQAFDPIVFSCYYSGFEFYQIILDYFATIFDLDKLFFNLVHNLGTIYYDTTDLIALARYGDTS